MPSHKVRFTICGSSYVVSTNDTEEYMLGIAEKLDADMNQLMKASPSASVTSAAVITALGYLDESLKNTFGLDNMRTQIQAYLEDAAKARVAEEEAKREAAHLRRELEFYQKREQEMQKMAAKAVAEQAVPIMPPPEETPFIAGDEEEPETEPQPYPGQIRLEEL